jgi:hypothetical protein
VSLLNRRGHRFPPSSTLPPTPCAPQPCGCTHHYPLMAMIEGRSQCLFHHRPAVYSALLLTRLTLPPLKSATSSRLDPCSLCVEVLHEAGALLEPLAAARQKQPSQPPHSTSMMMTSVVPASYVRPLAPWTHPRAPCSTSLSHQLTLMTCGPLPHRHPLRSAPHRHGATALVSPSPPRYLKQVSHPTGLL